MKDRVMVGIGPRYSRDVIPHRSTSQRRGSSGKIFGALGPPGTLGCGTKSSGLSLRRQYRRAVDEAIRQA